MSIKLKNVQELETYFENYRNGYLFRGQVKHYTNDNGIVNIPTSFSRHKCVPNIMFKWTHYSKAMIRAFSGKNYFDIDLEVSQAILQHYGWRSFYVDLTKSPQVACWFASNLYEESNAIHMCENIDEEPIWLVHKNSKYSNSTSVGHIYIIDKLALESLGIKIHDLTSLDSDEGKLRFNAQQACLVGHLDDNLPPEVIAAHLEVPATVLKEFYEKYEIRNVTDVFPPKEDDFILNELLSLPWEKMNIDNLIPTFRRGLEIPDYGDNFVKRLSPNVTLYENFWVSDSFNSEEEIFKDAVFYKLPQFSFYANTNEYFELDYVNIALKKHRNFFVELDGLIKVIEETELYLYEKGIHVSTTDDGYILVSGLVVSHPSHLISGVGVNIGWYYKVINGKWSRVDHLNQCPCNNDLRHELQFSLLRMLNEALKNDELIKENSLCYRHSDVKKA